MEHITETSVLIVGAGMAGLMAAYDLHREGIDFIVLEAAPRAGGRVYSVTTRSGSHIDLGGQWIGYGHHRVMKLAATAQSNVVQAYSRGTPRFIENGRSASLWSPSVLLGILILAIFDVIRRIPIRHKWHARTVDETISQSIPLATTRRVLRVLVSLATTAELHLYSVRSFADAVGLAGGLWTMMGTQGGAQDSLLVESMDSIISSFIRSFEPQRVLLNMQVSNIEADGTSAVVRTGCGQTFEAARVIVTAPPPMLKSIRFEPQLPKEHLLLQNALQMGVIYKAVAVFSRPFWRDRFSDCIVLDEPAFGVSDASPPDGPGHLCFLVPGTPARSIDTLDKRARRQKLLAALLPLVGPNILEPLEWHEKAWHLDTFCGGGYAAFPRAGEAGYEFTSVYQPVFNIHWAGTERAQEHPAYIEGALQSGQRAAAEVISSLQEGQ